MRKYLDILPQDLENFIIVFLFSLLIGLSQRKQFLKKDEKPEFGSDRTFTLIGILGYVLYAISMDNLAPFVVGGCILAIFLAINYIHKITSNRGAGITRIVTTLITYCLGPLVYKQEIWVAMIVIVAVLMLTEMKEQLTNFTKKINDLEFINLAKFFIISGVILPILPHDEIIKGVSLTPYNIWLATVVISGISYISYIIKRYIFKDGGVIITGILGGLYSSTATIIILSKKAKDSDYIYEYSCGIFCAIAMLYLRILILLGIFNFNLLLEYWYIFAIMIFLSSCIAIFFFYKHNQKQSKIQVNQNEEDKNPLEFKVAILFATLFIIFTLATHYTIQYYGDAGLNILSLIVGITDINPFIINLFQSNYDITKTALIGAAFKAILSNNIVQLSYGIFFSNKKLLKTLLGGFVLIIITNLLLVITIH